MLKPGDIVKIINQKYYHYNDLGIVSQIRTDGLVILSFDKFFENWTDRLESSADLAYDQSDLEPHDDYPTEIKVNMIFGKHNWHSVHRLVNPPNLGVDECSHENCQHKAARRCFINIWGSVCELDLCAEHADQCHGMCFDIFPWKKKAAV